MKRPSGSDEKRSVYRGVMENCVMVPHDWRWGETTSGNKTVCGEEQSWKGGRRVGGGGRLVSPEWSLWGNRHHKLD